MFGHFKWKRKSKERKKAYEAMRSAMVRQFNAAYGANAEDLTSWQKLCEFIQIKPVPSNMEECRRVGASPFMFYILTHMSYRLL